MIPFDEKVGIHFTHETKRAIIVSTDLIESKRVTHVIAESMEINRIFTLVAETNSQSQIYREGAPLREPDVVSTWVTRVTANVGVTRGNDLEKRVV